MGFGRVWWGMKTPRWIFRRGVSSSVLAYPRALLVGIGRGAVFLGLLAALVVFRAVLRQTSIGLAARLGLGRCAMGIRHVLPRDTNTLPRRVEYSRDRLR